MRSILAGTAVVIGGILAIAGCSSSSSSSTSVTTGSSTPAAAGSSSPAAAAAPVTVRLGYLANITHAPALIAVKNGYFAKDLGANTLKTTVYSTGTQETTAILAGQLDAAYVGPNPAINAFQKSSGAAIKIVSGVATGGASVVVKPSVTSASQLKGASLATPSLGNTQDVFLRYWLKTNGVNTTTTGGGDASIKPTSPNSASVLEFKSGQIAGASEPSPYDVEIVQEGGKVLLSEPGVTTILVVTQSFLSAHPDIVTDLLKANEQALDYIKSDPTAAATAANEQLAAYTDKPLKAAVLTPAFKEITFTDNPDASSLSQDASQAVSVGLLKSTSLNGIYDLDPLNAILSAAGKTAVSAS